MIRCPQCSSTCIVRNGLSVNGRPRLRCKNCRKDWTQGNAAPGARRRATHCSVCSVKFSDEFPRDANDSARCVECAQKKPLIQYALALGVDRFHQSRTNLYANSHVGQGDHACNRCPNCGERRSYYSTQCADCSRRARAAQRHAQEQ